MLDPRARLAPGHHHPLLLLVASLILFTLASLAPREAAAQTPCGGINQRACCLGARAWHWWGEIGGAALVTGSRWKPVATANLDGAPVGRAFEVRLQDTRDPRTHVSIYMFHTSGDDGATPKSWQETEAIVKLARQRLQPGDLAPLFVGDFNAGIGAPSGGFFSSVLSWWNLGNLCPVQPGVAQPLQFSMEQQILHILAGKRGAAIDFGCTSGHLEPVNLKYSRKADGEPTSRNDGIWLPNVAHNVVAMGLELEREQPERCEALALRKPCLERCRVERATCVETCAGPTAGACVQRCRRTESSCVARCPR